MRILVIDAEKSACELLVRTLEGYFPEHDWLTAFSYEEGIGLAQGESHLDLVLADIKTNEAGGPSLAHLIEGMFPGVQTYYLGTQGPETSFFRARPGRVFPKPVNIHEVVAAIQYVEASLAGDQSANEATGESMEKINRLIANEGFTGQINQFHLHEIVQLCCLGQRTGRMSVTKGQDSGAIYFYNGRILHAECGAVQGEDAVRTIIGWRSGQFVFAEGIIADRETIQASWDFLLLETMQKLDEAAAGGQPLRAEIVAGQCFGPYQIIRQLSAGEHEHVYEAQLTHTGLTTTLCVLPPARGTNPAAVKQFVAEATARSAADSSVFLHATKAAQTEGVCYYTLEHVDALNLEQFGPDRPLSELEALAVLRTVSRAMAELHAQHQLHRPLQPADVMIDSRGTVRLSNLATLHPDVSVPLPAQLENLAAAIRAGLGSQGMRSSGLKGVLRRMQRSGPDRILSWAGLRKAVEGVSASVVAATGSRPAEPDEHTAFVVNLVPDRPGLGMFKLGLAAGVAGLLVGAVFWVTGKADHVNAREMGGNLMAADLYQGTLVIGTNAPVAEISQPTEDGPRIFGSLHELGQANAAESTPTPPADPQ